MAQHIELTSNKPIKEIDIKYNGVVQFDREQQKNWNNIITQDVVSLSWYSVWYPQNLSVHIYHKLVTVLEGQKWFVVKGNYNEDNQTWSYGDQGFDPYNIVAYRKEKLHTYANQYMNLYTVEEASGQAAKNAADYEKIVEYFNGNLFKKKRLSVLDIACVDPAIKNFGAYRRKDLMWCSSLNDDPIKATWLLAHETAHIWCCGANTNSWEDWLNETTAEWSALLFAIKSGNTALFEAILAPKAEKYASLPSMKPADGSRPEGVHDKGTILFYQAYQASDFETMEKVVRCFSKLKIKNTRAFLFSLRLNGLSNIAGIIKQGLEK